MSPGEDAHDSFTTKAGRLRPALRCVVYALLIVAVALVVGVVIAAALAAAFGRSPPTAARYASFALSQAGIYAAVIGGAFALRRWLDRRSAASLGFPMRRGWARLFLVGAAFGAGAQLLVAALELAPGYAHVVGIGSLRGIALEAALGIPVFFVAAFAEELAFRGYLFQNLWEEWGVWPAAVITGVLFAVLHMNNPNFSANTAQSFVGLILFGLFAALSVVWTRSAWLVLGMHASWNYFEGPVLGFPVSGVDMPGTTVFAMLVTGPQWYTGGPFGPEAGITEIVALTCALLAMFWLHSAGSFTGAPDAREEYARP